MAYIEGNGVPFLLGFLRRYTEVRFDEYDEILFNAFFYGGGAMIILSGGLILLNCLHPSKMQPNQHGPVPYLAPTEDR